MKTLISIWVIPLQGLQFLLDHIQRFTYFICYNFHELLQGCTSFAEPNLSFLWAAQVRIQTLALRVPSRIITEQIGADH